MASVFLPHSVSCILLVLCQDTVTVYKVGYSQQTRLRFKYVVNSVNFLQYGRKVTTCNLFFNTLTVYFTKLFLKTYIKRAQKALYRFQILSIYLGFFPHPNFYFKYCFRSYYVIYFLKAAILKEIIIFKITECIIQFTQI